MTFGKVYDVDIIPDACAVFGGIVIAEHIEVVELAYGNLWDIGHEVIGNTVGVLTDESAYVCADGVKVAKEHDRPLVIRGVKVC